MRHHPGWLPVLRQADGGLQTAPVLCVRIAVWGRRNCEPSRDVWKLMKGLDRQLLTGRDPVEG